MRAVIVATLLLQAIGVSQTGRFPALFMARADASGWAPVGRSLAYSDGEQIAIVDFKDRAVERCRLAVPGVMPPIHEIHWSPDAAHIAFLGTRRTDNWHTIWLTTENCSEARDILPQGVGPQSPGIRALMLSTWTDLRTVAFTHHCGPGCNELNTIRIDNGQVHGICAAEGPFHWNRKSTQAIGELHLGGLSLVTPLGDRPSSPFADCITTLRGCRVTNGKAAGTSYEFESWSPVDTEVIVTAGSCETVHARTPELLVWDVRTSRASPVIAGAMRASFSPDGKRLAYVAVEHIKSASRIQSQKGTIGDSFNVSLAIANSATYRIERVVRLGTSDGEIFNRVERDRRDFQPEWSADSRYLVARDAQRNVWVVGADSERQRIGVGDIQTSWAPTGAMLAMSDRNSRTLNVVVIP